MTCAFSRFCGCLDCCNCSSSFCESIFSQIVHLRIEFSKRLFHISTSRHLFCNRIPVCLCSVIIYIPQCSIRESISFQNLNRMRQGQISQGLVVEKYTLCNRFHAVWHRIRTFQCVFIFCKSIRISIQYFFFLVIKHTVYTGIRRIMLINFDSLQICTRLKGNSADLGDTLRNINRS